MSWLRRLLRRDEMERDLDRELAFHVEAQTQDLVRAGVPLDEARRQARVLIGGVEQVKEDARDARGTRWVEDWIRDTRLAVRGMARSPAFTAAAVVTLAIGVGANTAVWSIVDALMLRSLPVEAPEELRAIRKVGFEDDSYLTSYIRYQRLRAALPDTTRLAAMSAQASMYAIIGGTPVGVNAQLVTGNWFPLLGVGAQLGRPLGPQDDTKLGDAPVAVLSDEFWRAKMGADPAVVGRALAVNGAQVTVVGVAERGFGGLTVGSPVDIWMPVTLQHDVKYAGNSYSSNSDTDKPWLTQYGIHWLTLIGRAEDSGVSAMQSRLNAQYKLELEEEFKDPNPPQDREARMRERLAVEPIGKGFSGLRDAFKDPLRMLFLSVAAILLIACGNLAGLLLARGAARTHEIAVRVSLGARPGRLVRQMLTESLTLAAFGGALSIAVAYWGSRALLTIASTGASAIPLDVPVDARMVAFALLVSLAAGILFGLAPALRAARADLYDSFKTGGRVVSGGSHRLPLGRTLLVAQIALSLLLVTSAGLFVRTFQNFLSIDPGFDADNVVVARIDVLAAGYTNEQLPALYERLTSAARNLPGVRSVALSWLVLGGGGRSTSTFAREGQEGRKLGQVNYVTPEFFRTVGMALLRGREFNDADRGDDETVVIVSEQAARAYFGTVDVVGKRIGYGTPPKFEIIGVMRDSRVNSIKEKPQNLVFFPLAQGMRHVTNVTVRASGSTEAVASALRSAIHGIDPMLPLRDAVAISTLHERGLSRERMVARIGGALGFLALLLVGVGLYGVIAYSVSRRTNEMGVRLALGASGRAVSWLVLRESLTTIVAGLALGLALSFPALNLTRRLVFGVGPHDPGTLAGAATLLLAVGVFAALLPALRASRIDPIEAIRAE